MYPIPAGVDPIILARALDQFLLRPDTWTLLYEQGPGSNPTAVEFAPGLDGVEERELERIFIYAAQFSDLQTPPDWANWTYQQVDAHITGAILNGQSLAEVDAAIDALPGTVDGMRTGLHQVAAALVAIRTILVAMGKALLYIRNLLLKVRG